MIYLDTMKPERRQESMIFREYAADAIRVDASGADRYRFTITTNKVNRNGRQLNIAGLDTSNFEKNPLVYWSHEHMTNGLPIGRAPRIEKKVRSMEAVLEFDEDDEYAARIKGKVDRGFIRAVSIGYDIQETRRLDSESHGWPDIEVVKADLLEISIVGVAANPDALRRETIEWEREYLDSLRGDDGNLQTENERKIDELYARIVGGEE